MFATTKSFRFLVGLILFSVTVIVGTPSRLSADEIKAITVTEKENKGKVTLAKGESLVVKLPITTGTGYTWQVDQIDKKVLEQLGKPVLEQKEKRPGASGLYVFSFKPKAAGTSTLELNYLRTFEKGVKPARSFKIEVTVKE